MAVELTTTQRTSAGSPVFRDSRLFPKYRELVGTPFAEHGRRPEVGLDCLGVALWVLRLEGHELPDPRPGTGEDNLREFRRYFERVETPWDYDILYVQNSQEDTVHLVLEGGYFAITSDRASGVRLNRVRDVLSRPDVKIYRLRREPISEPERELEATAPESVQVAAVEDLFSQREESVVDSPGKPVLSHLPEHYDRSYVQAFRNGRAVEDLAELTEPGDRLRLYKIPGAEIAVPLLISFLVSAVLSAATYAIARATAPSPDRRRGFRDSATYGFDGIVNTYAPGTRIPIPYGLIRVGGQVLQSFETDPVVGPFSEAEDATGVLNTLLSVGSGGRYGLESLSDVRVDRNPAGNFPSVETRFRLGDVSQAPVDGFEEIRSQVIKGDEVTQAGGAITYTTLGEVDRFGVVFFFPQGLIRFDRSGNARSNSVEIFVDYRVNGSSTWLPLGSQFVKAKTRSPKKVFFESPTLDRATYDIRITRVTADDDQAQATKISTFEVFALTEISGDKLSYPGLGLYAVRLLPTNQFSGAPPIIDVLCKGRRVEVYSSPTSFSVAWSRNPAWCLLDYMTDPTDGLGAFIDLEDVLLDEFIEWAEFCDELVEKNESGGTEPRAQLDFVIDGSQRSFETMRQMASTGRAFLRQRGTRWGIVIDRDEPPVEVLTMGRTMRGEFEVSVPRTQDRPNVFTGEFFNAETDYEREPVTKEDPLLGQNDELVETSLNLVGTTSPSQADRILNYHMLNARLNHLEVELEVGVDQFKLEAGQIVQVAHDVPQWGFSGKIRRVLEFSQQFDAILILDREVTIEAGKSYELTVVHPDREHDAIDVATVANEPGTTDRIVVSQGITRQPVAGTDYAFGEVKQSTKVFRVMSITRGNHPWQRKVRVREHNPEVYGTDLRTLPPPPTTALPDPRRVPPAPTELRIVEEQVYEPDGTLTNRLNVHFSLPALAGVGARVYYRELSAESPDFWELAGETRNGFFAIRDVETPEVAYEVSVVSCTQLGLCLSPDAGARGTILTKGVTRQPDDPTGLVVDRTIDGVAARWTPLDPVENFDLDHYELRVGTQWGTAIRIGTTTGTEAELRVTAFVPSVDAQNVTFLLKAVNKAGNYSALADSFVVFVDGRVNENVIATQQEDPTFSGTLEDVVVESSKLVFRESSGIYTTPKFEVSQTDPVRALVYSVVEAVQGNKTLTWDSPEVGPQTWDSDFAQETTWDADAGLTDSVRLKLEMRFSILTDDDADFGPWQERSLGFEANVTWAQARITVEIDDPNFEVQIAKLRFLYDAPDILDSGSVSTPAAGSASVSFNRAFHAVPQVIPSIVNSSAGDELVLSNKSITGFDIGVRNAGVLVARSVDWQAKGF